MHNTASAPGIPLAAWADVRPQARSVSGECHRAVLSLVVADTPPVTGCKPGRWCKTTCAHDKEEGAHPEAPVPPMATTLGPQHHTHPRTDHHEQELREPVVLAEALVEVMAALNPRAAEPAEPPPDPVTDPATDDRTTRLPGM